MCSRQNDADIATYGGPVGGSMSDHPSGRPIRRKPAPLRAPMWSIPHTGPVIPRLQYKQQRVEMIGFMSGPVDYWESGPEEANSRGKPHKSHT